MPASFEQFSTPQEGKEGPSFLEAARTLVSEWERRKQEIRDAARVAEVKKKESLSEAMRKEEERLREFLPEDVRLRFANRHPTRDEWSRYLSPEELDEYRALQNEILTFRPKILDQEAEEAEALRNEIEKVLGEVVASLPEREQEGWKRTLEIGINEFTKKLKEVEG